MIGELNTLLHDVKQAANTLPRNRGEQVAFVKSLTYSSLFGEMVPQKLHYKQICTYLMKIDTASNLPRSRTYIW